MTDSELQSLQKHFRGGLSIDDPAPFTGWLPSPEQLEEFSAVVRATWSRQEELRRLRPDLRPAYRRADGIREDIDASAYQRHHERPFDELV